MQIDVRKENNVEQNRARIIGNIESPNLHRDVWFDVPAEPDSELLLSGAPWILATLPFAVKAGEAVQLSLPLDPCFLENIKGLMYTWSYWYPDLHKIEIEAPIKRAPISQGRRGQFFSGGVDSWFTLLRHVESTPRFPQIGDIDDLITIGGFDIPLQNTTEFEQLARLAGEVAAYYGKRSVVVTTNLRENRSGVWGNVWGMRWATLSHGAGLAAVGLAMEPRYELLKIASTHRFWEPFPYGSHPLTDQLFSTSRTTFLHDHALYSRTDKIERIAESDYALSKLKVCTYEGKFRNCSQCVKCHRMLLCFDVLGVLEKAKLFDLNVYESNRKRPFLISSDNDYVRAYEVRDLALRFGRTDIASLVDESVKRSKRAEMLRRNLAKISWRAWSSAYRYMVGDMIGA